MIKKKPSVLLISFVFSPNIGGVESHLDDLVHSLTHTGHTVTVITYQPILSKQNAPSIERKKNLEIRRISCLKLNLFNRLERFSVLEFLYLVPHILLYSCFFMIAHHKKFDVIQAHGFNMAFVGAVVALIYKKRLVVNTHVSFHFTPGALYSTILQFVLNRASKILVLTKQARHELIKIGVKQEKIIIYHQWIDTDVFEPKDRTISRRMFDLDPNKLLVLFTGRFIAPKGVLLLLESSKLLHKHILVVFVGSGPLGDVIKARARDDTSLRFIGEVKRHELPYLFSAADITIIPSQQGTKMYAEGIPRVLIESFTCGTPVISTSSGGLKELISSNVGYFIHPSAVTIAHALHSLYKQRQVLLRKRQHCIDYAHTHFDQRNNVNIIEQSLL